MEPHTHYCTAGEHNVEHGSAPCLLSLRFECPACLAEIEASNAYRERKDGDA